VREINCATTAGSKCDWCCELSRTGGAMGGWETGTDLAAQHEGLSQCEQAHLALAGARAQSEFAVKTLCAPDSRRLNRMTMTSFTCGATEPTAITFSRSSFRPSRSSSRTSQDSCRNPFCSLCNKV